ncbi:hypothetical protein NQ317_008897 [Molorchus minor]|uniref:Uncharacterized protein n=1 Tax=Molorchus minor TaxID=1323400 RepID=A0ABQ9IXF7_9CUCU|nr:hypothetical protein NQ317_008897 [Molorchus minor]
MNMLQNLYYCSPVMPTDKLCDGVVNQSLNDSVRILNIILGFGAFNEYSSLFIPLSTENKGWRQPTFRKFDLLDYEHDLPYHSSAILASALDTFTLKYRLKETNFSIADLCTDLNRYERRAAAASLHLPFPFDDDSTLLECLDNWQGPLSQSITPNCEIGSKNLMQYITLRGIKEEKLKQPPHLAKKQINLPAYACDTITEMLNLYLAYSTEYSASNVTVVCKPLNTQTPFPQMVKKYSPGNTINKQTKNIGTDIPVLAGLHNGSFVGDMLESLLTEAKRIKLGKMHPFTTEGLESDEIHECLNSLHTLRENYTEDCFL